MCSRARLEGWRVHGRGRPRILDYPDGSERAEAAAREAQYDEAQAALEREAGVVTIDLQRAENLTHRVLATHSAKLKVTLSELMVQTAEELRSGDVKPKDRALAMVAMKTVGDRLYGWQDEPSEAELSRMKTGMINLDLIGPPLAAQEVGP